METTEKIIRVDLTQEEANLVLRAVELLEESCVAAVEPEEVRKLTRIWDRVFDAGLNEGFGQLPDQEMTEMQTHDVFESPE